MRIELISDPVFSKRELRTVITQARRLFIEHVDEAPDTFEVVFREKTRIKRIKGMVLNRTAIRVQVNPNDPKTKATLATAIAYFMICAYRPEWERRHQAQVLRTSTWPKNFDFGVLIEPVPPKKKPRLGPQARYDKCLTQVEAARVKVIEQQKKLDRASRHLQKKENEAARLLKALTKTPTLKSRESKLTLRDQLKNLRNEA